MPFSLGNQDLDKFFVIGDRVLIRPKSPQDRTKSGLFLPPGVVEKEKLQAGYIIKVGPGYPIPAINDIDEPWKTSDNDVKYVPLQSKIGDLAIFLQGNSFEIMFNKEKYIIVPHSAILLIIKDQELFE